MAPHDGDEVGGDDGDDDYATYDKKNKFGRWYKYDGHHKRIYAKPLQGLLRPPYFPADEWAKLTKKTEQHIHSAWKATRPVSPKEIQDLHPPRRRRPKHWRPPLLPAAGG